MSLPIPAPTLEQRILAGNLDLAFGEATDLACILGELQYTARSFLRPSAEDGTPPITAATAGLIFVSFVRGWLWGRTVFMMPSSGPDKVLAAELRKASMALAAARQGRGAFGCDSTTTYICELEDIVGSRLARSGAAQPLCRLNIRRIAPFPSVSGSWRCSLEAFPRGGNDPELQAVANQADVGTLARLVCEYLDGYDSQNVLRELKSEFALAAAFRVGHGTGLSRANGLDCHVTLDKMAAIVDRSKRTLEKLKTRRKNPLPVPDVEGGGGRPHEWKWSTVRLWLQQEFGRVMPEQFPSNRFRDARADRN